MIGPGSNPVVRLSGNIDDVSASKIRTPLVALSKTLYDRHFASSTRSRRRSGSSLTHLAGLLWILSFSKSQCRVAQRLIILGIQIASLKNGEAFSCRTIVVKRAASHRRRSLRAQFAPRKTSRVVLETSHNVFLRVFADLPRWIDIACFRCRCTAS